MSGPREALQGLPQPQKARIRNRKCFAEASGRPLRPRKALGSLLVLRWPPSCTGLKDAFGRPS